MGQFDRTHSVRSSLTLPCRRLTFSLDVSFATAARQFRHVSFRARGTIQTRLESRDRVFEKTQKSCRAFKSSLRYDYVEGWPAVLTREYDQVSLSRSWKRFNLPRHNSEQLYEKSHSSQEGLNGPPACAKLNEGPPESSTSLYPTSIRRSDDEYRLSNLAYPVADFEPHFLGETVLYPPLARSSGVVGRLVRRLLGNSCGGLGRHSQSPALTADLVPVSTVVPHPSRPIVARGWGTRPKSHSSSSGAREWENRSNIYRPDRRLCDKAADRVQ